MNEQELEQWARETQEATASTPESLPYLTRIVMGQDIVSARHMERRVREGSLEANVAVSLTGSYARMDLAQRLRADGLLDDETLFRNLPDWWVVSDPDDADPKLLDLWKEAYEANGGLIKDGRGLPSGGQTLSIFRGQRPDDPRGIAWSLSKDVAERFARGASFRTPIADGVILGGRVRRDAVIAYLTGRNEREVIVDPIDVTVTKMWGH